MICPRCQASSPNKPGSDDDKHTCPECNFTDKLMHFKPKLRAAAIDLLDQKLSTLRETIIIRSLDLAENTDMIVDMDKINYVWDSMLNKPSGFPQQSSKPLKCTCPGAMVSKHCAIHGDI